GPCQPRPGHGPHAGLRPRRPVARPRRGRADHGADLGAGLGGGGGARGPPPAGMHAVLALLVALEHRRQTGEGQLVESTMVEAVLNATADQVLEWQADGRLLGRDGNPPPEACPQNVYACRGDEQWLALAVETDAQWYALVELLERPAW